MLYPMLLRSVLAVVLTVLMLATASAASAQTSDDLFDDNVLQDIRLLVNSESRSLSPDASARFGTKVAEIGLMVPDAKASARALKDVPDHDIIGEIAICIHVRPGRYDRAVRSRHHVVHPTGVNVKLI